MARWTSNPRAVARATLTVGFALLAVPSAAQAQEPAPPLPGAAEQPAPQPTTPTTKPAPSDADALTPPPGTPGSTAADEPLTPPPGTPGSTASKKKAAGPRPKLASGIFPPPPVPVAWMPWAPDDSEGYRVSVSSRTYVRVFQRKFLSGNVVTPEEETLVPIYEYASLRVDDMNSPWQKRGISMRLSAWGMLDTMDVSDGNRLSGDLTAANVRSEIGPGYVTIGRQVASGAAARFTRFDGLTTGLRLSSGFAVDAYTGFAVKPRFGSRPEYVLLGSRADSMLRNPGALPSVSESQYWVGGGRLSYSSYEKGSIGASIHDERDRGDAGRRWAALDASLHPASFVSLGGQTALDLRTFDNGKPRIADARAFADVRILQPLNATLDFVRTDPSAFLSGRSVLSVFSLDTFTEAGGELSWRAIRELTFAASAHHQWFSDDTSGNRFGGAVRGSFGPRRSLTTQVRYQRVTEPVSGYHSVRGSIAYQLPLPVVVSAEVYQYYYDHAIRDVSSSTVGSGTIEYNKPGTPWRLMLGGFVARTPYATLDSQGIARLSYDFEMPSSRRTP